ncbi:MAG: hypothetical protein ACOCXQ_04370 [Patescibacteria group bacterium]
MTETSISTNLEHSQSMERTAESVLEDAVYRALDDIVLDHVKKIYVNDLTGNDAKVVNDAIQQRDFVTIHTMLGISPEELLEKASKGKCHVGCLCAAYELISSETQVFDRYLLLRSSEGPFVVTRWPFHEFLLLREQKDPTTWHAVSPANNSNESINGDAVPFLQLRGRLGHVVDQIQHVSKGRWESAKSIQTLVVTQYRQPVLKQGDSATTLAVLKAGTFIDYEQVEDASVWPPEYIEHVVRRVIFEPEEIRGVGQGAEKVM